MICAYGSHQLGVHAPGSALDILAVGPAHMDPRQCLNGNSRRTLDQDPPRRVVSDVSVRLFYVWLPLVEIHTESNVRQLVVDLSGFTVS
jgi:poly(A) polymerase Pap1